MKNPVVYENGDKFWYNEKGQYHRDDGPAIISINGSKEYWISGKLHRDHGPAYEGAGGYKEYWLNGTRYKSLEEGLMEQALG